MSDESPMYNFKTDPFDHQLEACKTLFNNPYFGVFDEMGTGKSKVMVDVAGARFLRGKINLLIVICPKGLIQNWANPRTGEIVKHMSEDIPVKVISSDRKPLAAYINGPDLTCDELLVLVTNYESLRNEDNLNILKLFAEMRMPMIVFDESTKVKTHNAQVTKAALDLVWLNEKEGESRIPYRYVLTGTPIAKNPLDFWSQFRLLNPAILHNYSYYGFKNRFATVNTWGGFSSITDWVDLDDLREWTEPFYIRRLKKDCLDLPDKVYTNRSVPMTDSQFKHYTEMAEEAIACLEDVEVEAPVVITKLLKMSQIAAGFIIDDSRVPWDLSEAKITELHDVLAEGEKTIIYCRFIHEINKVRRALEEKNIESVAIYGDVGVEERNDAVVEFQTIPTTQVIICQVRTGGIGITLTAATQVVYMSNDYSWEVRAQSEDRAHRAGQTNKVTYIDMQAVTPDGGETIDHIILDAVMAKKELASEVLGDKVDLIERIRESLAA